MKLESFFISRNYFYKSGINKLVLRRGKVIACIIIILNKSLFLYIFYTFVFCHKETTELYQLVDTSSTLKST